MTDNFQALLKGLFAIDEDGNYFLRITNTAPKGDLANAVNTQSNRSIESLTRQCVVLDEDGNPAINLVSVKYGETFENAKTTKRLASIKAEAAKKDKAAKEAEKAIKQRQEVIAKEAAAVKRALEAKNKAEAEAEAKRVKAFEAKRAANTVGVKPKPDKKSGSQE